MSEGRRPNIIMITLDCVRPDHLGCYGYQGVETPQLDRLASNGVLFEQAITHAPNTWVSHATIFTGCLPAIHGLRSREGRLSPHVVTLAEWLSRHGYSTAGLPGSNLMGGARGFGRGFELYDEEFHSSEDAPEGILWRRDTKRAIKQGIAWAERASRPFFIWIHYIDTHHLPDLQLPEYFLRRFSPRWQHYDGKISYADEACIGEVVNFLEGCGLLDESVIIVFSDHGEELRDDDRPLHDGALGEDVIRVPLIIKPPRAYGLGSGRIPEQVRLLDLFPTICDLAAIPVPDQLQGISLIPLIQQKRWIQQKDASLAYIENLPRGYIGIRCSEWKLIMRYPRPERYQTDTPVVEALYHLPTDPKETTDLSSQRPLTVQWLRERCLRWASGGDSWELSRVEQQRLERTLRALGYI